MKTSKLTLVCDIYELTNKDRKNIQKLARKIEEGKGIAGRFRNGIFKKSSYNASTILLAKIAYKYQGREETLSLLHYAISHKNNQAVKDLLEEAKKQKLLKEVLNEEMTTKHSDGREETHTILTDAISRRDNDMIRAVLKISEEYAEKFKDIFGKYKSFKEELKSKQSIGKEEFDKLSELADEFNRANKNFTQRKDKENESVKDNLRFDDEAINELRSHVIEEIKQARAAAEEEIKVLREEQKAAEEIVMQLQMSGSIQTPSSAFNNVTNEPVAGPSWRI